MFPACFLRLINSKEGIVLRELAEGVTVEEIQAKTEARLIIPDVIGTM